MVSQTGGGRREGGDWGQLEELDRRASVSPINSTQSAQRRRSNYVSCLSRTVAVLKEVTSDLDGICRMLLLIAYIYIYRYI